MRFSASFAPARSKWLLRKFAKTIRSKTALPVNFQLSDISIQYDPVAAAASQCPLRNVMTTTPDYKLPFKTTTWQKVSLTERGRLFPELTRNAETRTCAVVERKSKVHLTVEFKHLRRTCTIRCYVLHLEEFFITWVPSIYLWKEVRYGLLQCVMYLLVKRTP